MKKLFFLFFMTLLPLAASADAVVEIGGIYYNLIGKADVAEVTSNPSRYSGSIDIPDKFVYEGVEYSVKSIGYYAFGGCKGLTSITIPNSVTSIGEGAFSNCSGLTSVTIPNSVTSIGDHAFAGCSGLTSVTIPNSVTSIGAWAFNVCSGLTSVTIGNSVTSIEGYAFYNCSGLTSVTIPNSVTSIGNYVFYGCSGLTSVTIGNSVTSIGSYAFYNCSSLASITIGNGIKYIYKQAFAGCAALEDVYCYAESVPYTDLTAFQESYPEYMTLHVPTASINAYAVAAPWKDFKSILPLEGTFPDNPEAPKCATPTIAYEKGELVFSCDTEGAIFVSEIKVSDAQKRYDSRVRLSSNYIITVYAMASGYADSEVATAMITWRDGRPQMAGFSNIELRGDQTSDTNGDGVIDVGDIMAIINQMARK